MHSSQSVFILPSDEISTSTDQPGLVVLRVELGDLSLIFPASDEQQMTDNIGTIDRLIVGLIEIRSELLRRAVRSGLDSRDPRYVPSSDEIHKNAPGAKHRITFERI